MVFRKVNGLGCGVGCGVGKGVGSGVGNGVGCGVGNGVGNKVGNGIGNGVGGEGVTKYGTALVVVLTAGFFAVANAWVCINFS